MAKRKSKSIRAVKATKKPRNAKHPRRSEKLRAAKAANKPRDAGMKRRAPINRASPAADPNDEAQFLSRMRGRVMEFIGDVAAGRAVDVEFRGKQVMRFVPLIEARAGAVDRAEHVPCTHFITGKRSLLGVGKFGPFVVLKDKKPVAFLYDPECSNPATRHDELRSDKELVLHGLEKAIKDRAIVRGKADRFIRSRIELLRAQRYVDEADKLENELVALERREMEPVEAIDG